MLCARLLGVLMALGLVAGAAGGANPAHAVPTLAVGASAHDVPSVPDVAPEERASARGVAPRLRARGLAAAGAVDATWAAACSSVACLERADLPAPRRCLAGTALCAAAVVPTGASALPERSERRALLRPASAGPLRGTARLVDSPPPR